LTTALPPYNLDSLVDFTISGDKVAACIGV
jgi:hypothetical protein